MSKKIEKASSQFFGLEPVLAPNMSKQDYIKLRQLWYKKAQDSGHFDVESFEKTTQTYTSAFFKHQTSKVLAVSSNYSASVYYDYLNTFLLHTNHIKQSPKLQSKYKIRRFFAHIGTLSMAVDKSFQPKQRTRLGNVNDHTANKLTKVAYDPANQPAKSKHNINYALNIYILQALVAGISVRKLVKSLRHDKQPLLFADKLISCAVFKDLCDQSANLTLGNIYPRIRMIHECTFQYLVAAGLESINVLSTYDLIGLDNPLIQNIWLADNPDRNLKFKSIAPKYFRSIY